MEKIENKNNDNEKNISLNLENKTENLDDSNKNVEKSMVEKEEKVDNKKEKSEKKDFGETRVFKVIKDSDLDAQSTRRMVIDKELLREKTENENIVSRKKENIEEVNNKNEGKSNNKIHTKDEDSIEVNENKNNNIEKEKKANGIAIKNSNLKIKQIKLVLVSVVVTLIVIGIMLMSTVFAVITKNSNTIVDGMHINNIDVSGLNIDEAILKLNEILNNKENNVISIKRGDYIKEIKLSDIEASFNINKAVNEAYEYGRMDRIFENNYKVLKSKLFKSKQEADFEYNNDLVEKLIGEISLELPDLALDSSYTIQDDKLIIKNSTSGVRIKKDEFVDNLKMAFAGENKLMQIPVQQCEQTKIDLDLIYDEVYKAPVEGYYTTEPKEIFKEEEGMDFGITLEEAKDMLKEDKEEYEIPLVRIKPTIVLENLDDEAFPHQLAFFATTYGTADVNRNTNIALAAKSINNVVLMPGEVFSYNDLIGECSAKTGYKPATTYFNGKLSTGIGGGICQVSTTLYNAVLRANLEIVERKNHSLGVTYVPAGQDAMVSIGSSDFKFKNNRNYPIRIVAYTGVGSITCEIYGLKQNPEYEVELFSQIISKTETNYKVETYKILKKDGKEESRTLLSVDTYKFH